MAIIDKVERPEFSMTGDEAEILWSMLDYYRSTLLWKCEGLTEDQLRRLSVPPSELSLLDLLRHLAGTERHWFQRVLQGRDLEPLYSITPDGQIDPLDPTPAEEVVQRFLTACGPVVTSPPAAPPADDSGPPGRSSQRPVLISDERRTRDGCVVELLVDVDPNGVVFDLARVNRRGAAGKRTDGLAGGQVVA
jgi:hypothetical protein